MKRIMKTKKTAKKIAKRNKKYSVINNMDSYFTGANKIINLLARSGAVKGGNQAAVKMMQHNNVVY